MQLFRFLLKNSRPLLLVSMAAGALAGAGSAYILARVNENINEIGSLQTAAGLVFLVLVMGVVLSELLSRLVLLRMSSSAVHEMRLNLCGQILRAPLRTVEQRGASGLMAALTDDIHRIAEALLVLPAQCVNLAIAVSCFVYLFLLSWPLATGFVVIFGIGIAGHELITRFARPQMIKGRQHWDDLIANYSGVINGNKELKLNRRRRNSLRSHELRPTADAMMAVAWKSNWIVATGTAFTQLVFFALIGLVLFVAPRFAVFETSVLTGFVMMALFMSGPIASIVGASPKFHMADIALKKIHSLGLSLAKTDEADAFDEASNGTEVSPRFEGIELQAVCYSYERDGAGETPFALGPIDLAIRPGELLFVIGGNGSGKSSFIRVLTGLYAPSAGMLRFNGEVVGNEQRDNYRQNFSAVFSDYHLFRSLNGLSSGHFIGQAADYLDQLDLTDKVVINDGKLSTVELSQGQRKRLALLTAFLEDRHIYVFDEWAADQDPAFKRVFYYQILPALKARGKTVVVVSHDDHYFDAADRVVRFEEGLVIEDRQVERAVPLPAPAGV